LPASPALEILIALFDLNLVVINKLAKRS